MIRSIGKALRAPGTLLAIAALVVAATGTAVAARTLLTGRDIRDGSIGVQELSRRARAALRGQRGATGPRGATGATGAAGAAGAAGAQGVQGERGPSNLFIRTKESHTVDSGTRTVVTQDLPAGIYAVTAKLVADATGSGDLNCRLRTGLASDFDTTEVEVDANDSEEVTLLGTVTIPAGATGFDDEARVICFESTIGPVATSDIVISSIQVGAVTATRE